jgi:hypothetical protein
MSGRGGRIGFVILWVFQNKEMFCQKRFAIPENGITKKGCKYF